MSVSLAFTTDHDVDIVTASTIPIAATNWAWREWIATGVLTIVAGPPGTGKTTVALDFAATLSRGGRTHAMWPDGSAAPFGSSIIWSTEDSVEATLIPRLVAAEADLSHIHILRGAYERGRRRDFDVQKDLPLLCDYINKIRDVRLIIIDPISQVVLGDANKNAEVRRALQPLITVAQQYGAALIGISHLTKGSGKKPAIERVLGSIAVTGLARTVLMTGKIEADETNEAEPSAGVLVRAKSNIGPTSSGHSYQILPRTILASDGRSIMSSAICWNAAAIPGSAEKILSDAAGKLGSATSSKLEIAKAFLKMQLASGPQACQFVEDLAKMRGISLGTLRRAREILAVNSTKCATGNGHVENQWSLPVQTLGPTPTIGTKGNAALREAAQMLSPSWSPSTAPFACPIPAVPTEWMTTETRWLQTPPEQGLAPAQVEQVAQVAQVEGIPMPGGYLLRWLPDVPKGLTHLTIEQSLQECRDEYRATEWATAIPETERVQEIIGKVLGRNSIETAEEWQANEDLRRILNENSVHWMN